MPPKKDLKLELPHALVEAVKDKRVVLVFGAGSSKESTNEFGSTPPDGNQMRDKLAKKFLGKNKDERDLQTVSEIAISSGAGQPQVFEEIAKMLYGFKSSAAHRSISQFMWRGIATTNYDKLIELGYSDSPDSKQVCLPFVKDLEPYDDRLDAEQNPVALLKLHGCIDHRLDREIPLVLSHAHYHRLSDNRKLLMQRLQGWAQNSVLVFIGYKLADSHVRALVYDIDPKNRPQWFMVTPGADEFDIKDWATRGVDVIPATFGEFANALERQIDPLFRSLSALTSQGDQPYQKHFRTDDKGSDFFRQSIVDDLEYVSSGIPFDEVEPKKFYSGFDHGWCGIVRQLDFRRIASERMLYTALAVEKDELLKFVLLQGSAGAGKTIALKRAAYDAATALDEMVFWLSSNGSPRPEFFSELFSLTGKRAILFVDQISLHSEKIRRLLESASSTGIPLTIIAADREADWGSYCNELEAEFPPEIFSLRGLSETEAEDLVELLSRHKCLGMLKDKEKGEQVAAFLDADRSDRQLLVALHELTLGKPFENIILEEYQRVLPAAAQRLYLDISTMHQFGVTARAGAISRISGVRFEEFESDFFEPLRDIVKVTTNKGTGDRGYQCRHSRVAQIVFGVACETDEAKASQLSRVISGLDAGFSSDARIIEGVCRGRDIANQFTSIVPARRIFEMACETSPNSAFLFQQAAILEYSHRHGSLVAAEALAKQAREKDDNNHIYIHTLAEISRRQAVDADTRVRKDQLRSHSRTLLNEIWLKNSRKDLTFCKLLVDEAIDLLLALSDEPKDHEIIEFDAKVDDALERLQRASQDYPDHAEFSAEEARLWERLGDGSKAKGALRKAIRARPRNAGVFLRLAKLEKKEDTAEKSLTALREGLEKFPNDKSLHLQMGLRLLELSDTPSQDVEFHLRSSFSAGDHNFDARFYYAGYLFWTGRVDESQILFEEIDRRSNQDYRTSAPRYEDVVTVKLGNFYGTIEKKKERYFFVRYGGYPKALFGHWRSLQNEAYDLLAVNDPVAFRIRFNRKGPVAVEVKKNPTPRT
ncbi:'Cold-shock' DNA-binding domain-containing protein [Poseidonocella pacifica]|uniref:'Cold-shock' DNA-binding domain-containing protein n=1 Tax=Poseidonocella pacifica TaxID=871651 RepID=A0A1I0WCY8_9RHOB|nr:SIR2 family protein [Poseidonocella pacifica]SFA86582.1 'Cold-shock' DNA-binding domain-containing protein [Poseidonocella pacifica]